MANLKPRNKSGGLSTSMESRSNTQTNRHDSSVTLNKTINKACSSSISAIRACSHDVPSVISCNLCTTNPSQTEPPPSSFTFQTSLIPTPNLDTNNISIISGGGKCKDVEMCVVSSSSNTDQHSVPTVTFILKMVFDVNNQDVNATMEEDSSLNQPSH